MRDTVQGLFFVLFVLNDYTGEYRYGFVFRITPTFLRFLYILPFVISCSSNVVVIIEYQMVHNACLFLTDTFIILQHIMIYPHMLHNSSF